MIKGKYTYNKSLAAWKRRVNCETGELEDWVRRIQVIKEGVIIFRIHKETCQSLNHVIKHLRGILMKKNKIDRRVKKALPTAVISWANHQPRERTVENKKKSPKSGILPTWLRSHEQELREKVSEMIYKTCSARKIKMIYSKASSLAKHHLIRNRKNQMVNRFASKIGLVSRALKNVCMCRAY